MLSPGFNFMFIGVRMSYPAEAAVALVGRAVSLIVLIR